MPRLKALNAAEAEGQAKGLLEAVHNKFGMVPNMMRTMANAPAVLEGYLSFSSALGNGSLSPKLREQIALAVGEANGCQYCVSAHTAIGRQVGLDESDLTAARRSVSADPKIDAALQFARAVVLRRGEVKEEEVKRVRQAGYTDGGVAEIIANVALNIFTNYFNHVAATEVDFPKVELGVTKVA